jgi:hypothetical protein
MTVTTVNNRNTYSTNGVTTVFPVTFKFRSSADLLVYFVSAAGAVSVPVLNTDYVVNMFVDFTGELVFTPGPANNGSLHIIRRRVFVQSTSSIGKEEFSAAETEIIADNLMFFIQDLADLQARSMVIQDYAIEGSGLFDARSNRIVNLEDPVNLQDAVTKSWMLANGIPGPEGDPGPPGGLTIEEIQDSIATMLTAGTNITLNYNDAADILTINSTASGGGASVTISDTAPVGPTAGDMWWSSVSGTLRVRYADGTSSQWVDAVPVGAAVWGNLTGSIANQADLVAALGAKQSFDADLTTIAGLTATTDNFMQAKVGAWASRTVAQVKTDLSLTGTNSGDQNTIVGFSSTKAQFNTALSDGDFLYVGDVTQYTDELAQDAVGLMVNASLNYVDATPLLQRAALTGHITAPLGSNATSLGSFTMAELSVAVSDGDVSFTTHTHVAANVTDFNEAAQDAVGVMVDASLVYADATPLLSRGALTGHVTAALGSNATVLGAFTLAQLNTAITDADVEPDSLFKILTAGAAGIDSLNAQPWFPVAGAVTVEAATTYAFDGILNISRAAGAVSHTLSLLFGGTATLTSIMYEAIANTGDVDTTLPATITYANVATAIAVKAASVVTTEKINIYVRGTIRINTAGTLIPQFKFSAAPGGAPTVNANSFIELRKLGTNVVASRGTWA